MTTPEELDALQAELQIIGCHSNGDARCTCSIGADADAAITTLRARVAELEAELARRGQGVRVRPLAWKRDGDYLRAGPYVIEQTLYTFYIRYGDEHIYPGHKTLAEAQSAAQADYEARIRAALVSPGDGLSEYEKKVAQMKEDFPNGI